MRSRLSAAALTFVVLATFSVQAQPSREREASAEEFEAKLGYQTGTVSLRGGMATLRLPESFRFIGPEGSRRLLTEAWGNPPAAANRVLGMLIPTATSPLARNGWGIVITYEEEGYVNDSDAATIDYDKMLAEMRESAVEANKARQQQGFEPVTLVGWAEPPHYDAGAHKLYWAKELAFGADGEHTLNYSIRVLGRRGVLVLNAVASMEQLPAIRQQTQSVLSAVDFSEGHRYSDYLPGTDKAAAYGITGLIVGATAAKAGFFKLLIAGLVAFKKALVVGVLALISAVKALFGGKKREAPGTA
ncbi:MAG TPA: DUF2167 domain-containing protein [Vicinamibacterales bacterium]|jgi:uncharacterized membrane-anchored protein